MKRAATILCCLTLGLILSQDYAEGNAVAFHSEHENFDIESSESKSLFDELRRLKGLNKHNKAKRDRENCEKDENGDCINNQWGFIALCIGFVVVILSCIGYYVYEKRSKCGCCRKSQDIEVESTPTAEV